MKKVSSAALAILISLGVTACSSNSDNAAKAPTAAEYSKTTQGKADLKAIKDASATLTNPPATMTADVVKAKKDKELVTASKNDQAYAQFGVFRTGVTKTDTVGDIRYAVLSTADNKLDAAKAAELLSAKDDKGAYKKELNATYTGKLVYSAKEKSGEKKDGHLALNVADLTLHLNNDKIGGEATDTINHRNFVFNAATVANDRGELAYNGKVYVSTEINGKAPNVEEGTYRGFFGSDLAPTGEKGKETYADVTAALKETAGEINTPSFKGAFDGKK